MNLSESRVLVSGNDGVRVIDRVIHVACVMGGWGRIRFYILYAVGGYMGVWW